VDILARLRGPADPQVGVGDAQTALGPFRGKGQDDLGRGDAWRKKADGDGKGKGCASQRTAPQR